MSNPIIVVNIARDDAAGEMDFYVSEKRYRDQETDGHELATHVTPDIVPIAACRWFHLEAFYRRSTGTDGAFVLWLDGRELFRLEGITTALTEEVS